MGHSPPPNLTTGAKLKLIKTGLSDTGTHIHVHFVSTQNDVVTVQLEITLATQFLQSLSNLLSQLDAMDAAAPQRH